MVADPLKNLGIKKRKYAEGVSKGKTRKQAALDAGYSASVAKNAKAKIESEAYQEAFAALIRKTIPAEKIAQRIQEGMDAMETKFFQKDGEVIESRDVIAWGERRAYAELAAEFGNLSPSKVSQVLGDGILSFTISFVNAGHQTST
jgi:phage terminase small subunit